MGILGKDLWTGESIDFFEFTALFSNDTIEIGDYSYRYAQSTTEFLNYDPSEYKKAMSAIKSAHGEKDEKKYITLAKKINALILSMPLYKDFTKIENLMSDRGQELKWSSLVSKNDVFHHYHHYLELENAFDNLLPRYKWFLKEISYRETNKRSDDRYALQIEYNNMSPLVSGVSLGTSGEVDPAQTTVKYEVKASKETGEPQLYEKMNFIQLTDFIYTDFFKAIMKGSIPKQCKLCGRYFLQEKGVLYEYCDNPTLGDDKTCRQIGALTSFRDKVKGNDVWRIHQRAYKKYYARVLKGKMSKANFNEWAQRAEQIRDETLASYEAAQRKHQDFPLDEYTAILNEV